jgi:hypothetical protein
MYLLISSAITFIITCWIWIQWDQLEHWMMIPLFFCGTLMMWDVSRWMAGKVQTMDVSVLYAPLFLNAFFLAPSLQYMWQFYPGLPNIDWRTNLGIWAVFSFFGLIVFRISMNVSSRREKNYNSYKLVKSDKNFNIVSIALIAISGLALAYVFISLGGLGGITSAYSMRATLGQAVYNPYEGMGVQFILSTSFAVVTPMIMLIFFKDKKYYRGNLFFVLYILLSVVLSVLAAGAFGSRARIIYPIFISMVGYHFLVRPIPKNLIIAGAFAAFSFMNVYYWYKMGGVDGLAAIFDEQAQAEILSRRHVEDEEKFTIIRDFSRADVQSFLISMDTADADYAYGRTYIGGLFAIVPRAIFPDRPDTASREKTEALMGPGRYSDSVSTTLLVGLFGEAMLNFGPWIAVLFYAIPGWFAGVARRMAAGLQAGDLRRLLIGPLSILPVVMVFADSNVVVMFVIMYFLFPLILLRFGCKRQFTEKNTVKAI